MAVGDKQLELNRAVHELLQLPPEELEQGAYEETVKNYGCIERCVCLRTK